MTNQDLTHLRPESSDEIDLGELIRNLMAQWKLICGITLLGAILSIIVALSLPNQYRVEAIFDKPSTRDIRPLLSQTLIPLTRQAVLGSFLKNLKSRELIEQALESQGALVRSDGTEMSTAERFTTVSNISNTLNITPATYDFVEELEGVSVLFDQISLSKVSKEPEQTALWINELLKLASNKTSTDLINDILGQRDVNIAKAKAQLAELEATAAAERTQKIEHLQAALAIATELNIQEPTSWSALVHGKGKVSLLNEQPKTEEDFLKGTRVLTSELEILKTSPLALTDLVVENLTITPENGHMVTTSVINPNTIKGQIATLEAFTVDASSITYIKPSVQALVPANAEKPNRKLIVVAATVLAGFFALFVALIRLAVRKK